MTHTPRTSERCAQDSTARSRCAIPARCVASPRGDSGFALPIAIIVLLIVTVLAGAAIALAVQSSTSTTRDTNVKAEIEAAEAGLQVASYRLGQIKPGETQCINASAAVISGCNDSVESIGNGATYQYWTTLPLKVGEKCAGRTLATAPATPLRCVTAEGLVNGVKPGVRLQTSVTSSTEESLFSVKGIVGLEEILVTGSVKLPAVAASNGTITATGSAAFDRGFELCAPNGKFIPAIGKERKQSGVTVGGVKETPSLEVTRSASECPITAELPANHATGASNDDARIGVSDPLIPTSTWNAPNHELTLNSNGKVTLGGSKYYLCNFKATNNSRLKITPTAKVEIFVDSPGDPAGKCKAGTGKFEGEGEFIIENETKNPADLLIVMYGAGPLVFKNGSSLEASIYAPEAEVRLSGGTKFRGGIVAKKVKIENGTGVFEWNEEVGSIGNGVSTGYGRTAWEQCTPGSGASEGC